MHCQGPSVSQKILLRLQISLHFGSGAKSTFLTHNQQFQSNQELSIIFLEKKIRNYMLRDGAQDAIDTESQ